MDLSQLWHQRLHDLVGALTARIRIEHLLDLLQVGDDLAGDLRAQLNGADLLEKLRAQTGGWRSAGLAARRSAQPAAEKLELLIEVRRTPPQGVENAVGEQERRRHLDQQAVTIGRVQVRQRIGDFGDGSEQPVEVIALQRRGFRSQRPRALAEGYATLGLSNHVLAPEFLELAQLFAHFGDKGLQRIGVRRRGLARRLRHRTQAIQSIEQLDVADALRERCTTREDIEQLAQQRFVIGCRARREIAGVQVDLVPQPARLRELARFGDVEERVHHAAGDPPQRTPLRQRVRRGMDFFQRVAHLFEAVGLAAQPGKDAALPARALRLQE